MCKSHALRLTVVLGAAVSAFSTSYAQPDINLVTNGSFETPISRNNWPSPPDTLYAGDTFEGWRVTQANIDILRCGVQGRVWYVGFNNAYHGLQFLDLNGTPGIGGIAQDITINASGRYRLSFAMSGDTGPTNFPQRPNDPRTMRVELSLGQANIYTGDFTWDPANHPGHRGYSVDGGIKYDWHEVDIYIPNPGVYTLSFTSTYTLAPYDGAIIDDVRLERNCTSESGDTNSDGCVDDADLLNVLFGFGSSDPTSDINCDNLVDDADLLVVLFNFGTGC